MDTAAIYIRLSKEDRDKVTDESESIQNQRMILDSYANQQGWQIFDHYIDEDWSGSNRSRPEFHRMISDAKKRKFNIVLVKTQSRFARDSKFIEDYVHNLFAEKGIRFVSVVDNIDTSRLGSKLNSRVHAIFDEEQLDLLSSNIRRSFDEKARQGQFFGALPPYGYKKDPKDKNHLIIDEEAAAVVRTIFEMTAAGSTYIAIAKRLNDCAYPIPSEYKRRQGYNVDGLYDVKIGKWTRDMVRSFLTNEVYRGTIVNHKSTVVNFRTKTKRNLPKDQHIKCHNMHEAIISDELWDKVQYIRKGRRKASAGESSEKHPLSGKVICAVCGSKMYKCKSGSIPYFRCNKAASCGECHNSQRIRLDVLEDIIIKNINEVLQKYIDTDYLSKNINILNHLFSRLDSLIKRKSEIENEIQNSRNSLKKLLMQYMDNVIERSIYEEVQRDYLDNKAEYEKSLTAIDCEIEKLRDSMPIQKDCGSIIKRYQHIDALTIPIVDEYIDSITVSDINNGIRNIDINMNV